MFCFSVIGISAQRLNKEH